METVLRLYEEGGAAALSVLTDAPYFGGSLEDLRVARETTNLPILRKDFTLDPLQILEARVAGADAVLLIVRILDDEVLQRLIAETEALGMAALVEVHDERELKRALEVGAGIIGINNRDLATFTTDLDTTIRLLERVPEDIIVVSESGIRVPEDVDRLGGVGVDAVLVGESLLRSSDPGVAAQELARIPRVERSCG
jgi:indole-3-glycerol phosphate synthase